MSQSDSLPSRFPIFPLAGAVLLPRGNLPLNIFEPRYRTMVRDAMQTDQIIGMIQPREESEGANPKVYQTGCAGRISNFNETEDGRYEITLTGITRFDVAQELDVTTPYRQVIADFARWGEDLQPKTPSEGIKVALLPVLQKFFDAHDIEADWQAIKAAPIAGLVTSLAMICPFESSEKQALLEAEDLEKQGKLLIALMQMAALGGDDSRPMMH